MGKRRFISTSEDEEEEAPPPPPPPPARLSSSSNFDERRSKRKSLRREEAETRQKREENGKANGADEGEEAEEEETPQEDAKPIGEVLRTTGKGKWKKGHFASFEYDGNRFDLEDPVLLTPEEKAQKPYVAIIKDITQSRDGSMMVTGQWFYRPEEAEKKGGGNWEAHDTRELFYSFHRDDVPAESVMHRCVVHFVPLNKKLPVRSEHPGFIVQKVYDTVERKLWKLTDKDYEDSKQHEIDLLVQKTRERLGELADVEPEDGVVEQEEQLKSKRTLRKKTVTPIDVTRHENGTNRSEQQLKAETPGSCSSEFYQILASFKALTGDLHRDKWVEKLLEAIQVACNLKADDAEKNEAVHVDQNPAAKNNSETAEESQRSFKGGGGILWPDSVVPAVTALEQASHDALGSDFQKYNQKMRQMCFNLKKNELLARRLLNKELEPSVVLNMSPIELKDGLTAEEKSAKEPEEAESMQMTDVVCTRCTERKVGVADIIQAGGSADRYLLKCIACGNSWYASRDVISSLTVDTPNAVSNVGTAPWATDKFENVEKRMLSPRDSEKPSTENVQKSTTSQKQPVLETQKSFTRVKTEEPTTDNVQKSTTAQKQPVLESQKSFNRAKREEPSCAGAQKPAVLETQKSLNRIKREEPSSAGAQKPAVMETQKSLNRIKPEEPSSARAQKPAVLETQKSLNRIKPEEPSTARAQKPAVLETQKSLNRIKPEEPSSARAQKPAVLETQKSLNRIKPEEPSSARAQKPAVLETQKSLNRIKPEEPTTENVQKSTTAHKLAVLETQKSFKRVKAEEPSTDSYQKSAHKLAVLETQKSFNRAKAEEPSTDSYQKSAGAHLDRIKAEEPSISTAEN
ncbi:ASI1-immunoprecipitated protein 3-like isoform X2 [Aristolochia californica]|uniref:ASI1-immunoprecipitated protein 3-like isoform X2 n=1 Tax=Aristolochia californica TaxID=171875 RepID=UPI0035DEF063